MMISPSLIFKAQTTEEMKAFGALVAQKLLGLGEKPFLLLIEGNLGAGKTTFSQGFFKALGVQGEVTSPSYGILHAYEGEKIFYHMDMYRICSEEDFEELEVEEILGSQEPFIFVVEWASKFPKVWENFPQVQILKLSIRIEKDETRSLQLEGL